MKEILIAFILMLSVTLYENTSADASFHAAGDGTWVRPYVKTSSVDIAALKTAIDGDGGITTARTQDPIYHVDLQLLMVFMDADPSAAEEILIDAHVAAL